MKKRLYILFLSVSLFGFSQKKANKKIETSANEIEILTQGLDNITIENSESNFVEVFLFDENPNNHHILIEEKTMILNIFFKIESIKEEETVFRKFITKRLNRAYAIIKVPKNKSITLFGDHIDIESKDYGGSLDIYIEKGVLKLNIIQANTKVKLYAGNVYATLKKSTINVASNIGVIAVDKKVQQEKFYKKANDSAINFTISSIKANIFLTNL